MVSRTGLARIPPTRLFRADGQQPRKVILMQTGSCRVVHQHPAPLQRPVTRQKRNQRVRCRHPTTVICRMIRQRKLGETMIAGADT